MQNVARNTFNEKQSIIVHIPFLSKILLVQISFHKGSSLRSFYEGDTVMEWVYNLEMTHCGIQSNWSSLARAWMWCLFCGVPVDAAPLPVPGVRRTRLRLLHSELYNEWIDVLNGSLYIADAWCCNTQINLFTTAHTHSLTCCLISLLFPELLLDGSQHPIKWFLQTGCPSFNPINSVKTLQQITSDHTCQQQKLTHRSSFFLHRATDFWEKESHR